jgi:mono/diheme cytochrome c family protein
MIFMRTILLIIFSLLLVISDLTGQGWIVPDEKKNNLSTFKFDDNTRKAGEKLYQVNCISCHGTPGKGNYLNLVPPPGDPATEKIQRNNDGEIFFKVTTGRGQMPSFKSVLSSAEIWNVISFIRSFNSTYKQQIKPVITSSSYPGSVIKMSLIYRPSDSTIILKAIAAKKNNIVSVTGAEVRIFVHRTFGLLPIDETKTTDKGGFALFRVPKDLPGDAAGNVLINARFINEEIFGSVSIDTILNAAIKTVPISLTDKRAMWNNVKKAPVWLILTYGLGLLSAWGFILYVLMKLRDIFIIGETLINDISNEEN